ncbi:MAG: ABC transporter permease [Bacillota bacterium]
MKSRAVKSPYFYSALGLAGLLLSVAAPIPAADILACGDLANAFGPFDYRNAEHRKNLPIVETHHFTPQVESLMKAATGSLGADIDYTLRAFPNHLRALDAMARLSIREKTARPSGANYSIECYFDRAIRFRPEDGLARMAYGAYLANIGEAGKSIEHMQAAARLEPDNATVNYNLGLMYLKKKDYAQARTYAKKAYALGFPLSGLKNKLVAARAWKDDDLH